MKKTNELDKKIERKKSFAEKMFKKMFDGKQQKAKDSLFKEILTQIEVCEELRKPVTKAEILDWLKLDNVIQVSIKARTHKLAA